MKIYTKTGDLGETGMPGGHRVLKSHQTVEVCGALDELNSQIGLLIAELAKEPIAPHKSNRTIIDSLTEIQGDLFEIGATVSETMAARKKSAGIFKSRVDDLERWIDALESGLPKMRTFILPGGSPVACQTHVARTVCRRAERELVRSRAQLDDEDPGDTCCELVYLNRLSDALFTLARRVNFDRGIQETPWIGKTRES